LSPPASCSICSQNSNQYLMSNPRKSKAGSHWIREVGGSMAATMAARSSPVIWRRVCSSRRCATRIPISKCRPRASCLRRRSPPSGNLPCGAASPAQFILISPLAPQTPSLPDARPRSERFRCGGRGSNCLAVGVRMALVRVPSVAIPPGAGYTNGIPPI